MVVHQQAPFSVPVPFCPLCKTTETVWDLSCLLPSEFSIKDNSFAAPRQKSLNPKRTDCSGTSQKASPCHHRAQPVSTSVTVNLTLSKTSALGPKVLALFQILRSDMNLHNRCLSGIMSCVTVNMVNEPIILVPILKCWRKWTLLLFS